MASLAYDIVPKGTRDNLHFREYLLSEASESEEFQQDLVEACRVDPLFYINSFVWTFNPDLPHPQVKRVPMITWPSQDNMILTLVDSIERRYSVHIEKSRQEGGTWIVAEVPDWACRFMEDISVLFVSRVESLVDGSGRQKRKTLFGKLDFINEHLPWFMERLRGSGDRVIKHIGYRATGGVMDGESTTGNIGRGDTRTIIVVDELSSFDLKAGFEALDSIQHASKCRWFPSTPKGVGNAYHSARNSCVGHVRLHWSDNPEKRRGLYRVIAGKVVEEDPVGNPLTRRERAGLEEIHRSLREKGYPIEGRLRSPYYDRACLESKSPQSAAQELDCEYIGSGSPFFNQATLDYVESELCRVPLVSGELEYGKGEFRFREMGHGHLHLWMSLTGDGRPPRGDSYVIGCDVAVGTGASNSVAAVLNQRGEKVAQLAHATMAPNDFADYVFSLGRWFGRPGYEPEVIWESGGSGTSFGKRLMKLGHGNVYYRPKNELEPFERASDTPGWAKRDSSLTALLDELARGLVKGEYQERCKETIAECRFYRYDSNGKVEWVSEEGIVDPSGAKANHADRVIGTGLAWKRVSESWFHPRSGEEGEDVMDRDAPPIGSVAWFVSQEAARKGVGLPSWLSDEEEVMPYVDSEGQWISASR